MSASPWNHNIHYQDLVLRSVPRSCRRALDVGCGQGLLARRLSRCCEEVIAIDINHEVLLRANALSNAPEAARIIFLEADVMTRPFCPGSFDFIAAVATLHHLPLRPALACFRSLLKPGGTLAVIGLYRGNGLRDYAWTGAAFPVSWLFRCLHGGYADVGAPVQNPVETLDGIRKACNDMVPGAVLKRQLLFRYSLIWHKGV